jgi:hypothetical protein
VILNITAFGHNLLENWIIFFIEKELYEITRNVLEMHINIIFQSSDKIWLKNENNFNNWCLFIYFKILFSKSFIECSLNNDLMNLWLLFCDMEGRLIFSVEFLFSLFLLLKCQLYFIYLLFIYATAKNIL